jgi:hypothetical protein
MRERLLDEGAVMRIARTLRFCPATLTATTDR